MPRPRWLCVATGTAAKMRRISSSVKPSATRRSRERPATSSCAHGHAVIPWAATPTRRRVPCSEATAEPIQRVDLLRRDARHRRGLVLGVARGDRHLGAQGVLALAHLLGDVLGQLLGLEAALAEHDLADDVVDDLLEARHVRALLLGPEVDEAVELGVIELLCAEWADADDLLDVGHADARERDAHGGRRRLYVGDPRHGRPLHGHRRVPRPDRAWRRLAITLRRRDLTAVPSPATAALPQHRFVGVPRPLGASPEGRAADRPSTRSATRTSCGPGGGGNAVALVHRLCVREQRCGPASGALPPAESGGEG